MHKWMDGWVLLTLGPICRLVFFYVGTGSLDDDYDDGFKPVFVK